MGDLCVNASFKWYYFFQASCYFYLHGHKGEDATHATSVTFRGNGIAGEARVPMGVCVSSLPRLCGNLTRVLVARLLHPESPN